MFYVFDQTDGEGFHEIKNEAGEVIATAADTGEQAVITLGIMGHNDVEMEIVYDQAIWGAIGGEAEQMRISVRKATQDEMVGFPLQTVGLDDEQSDELITNMPKDMFTFDDTDWAYWFFSGIASGDWIVKVEDGGNVLNWQKAGTFLVRKGDDCGAGRKIA